MSLSTDAQLRYIVQWFEEWSELQRTDFVPVLAEKLSPAYVNGISGSVSRININDKPMSLFECRVKLFDEWYQQWSQEHRDRLLQQISDIDSIFAEKLNEEIKKGGVMTNGHANGSELDFSENEV